MKITTLHKTYTSYEEFCNYSRIYGIHTRLGFKTMKGAWRVNPRYTYGVNPGDFKRVK